MDMFVVEGGVPLEGSLRVKGAKNAVLPMLCAALMPESGEVVIRNMPNLADIRTMVLLLEHLGAKVDFDVESGVMRIDPTGIENRPAPYDLVRRMRASFMIMGALIGRFGSAKVSMPGGCAIGARPINWHLSNFARLGAKIEESHGYIGANCGGRPKGNVLYFDRPSHTGTENVMMAAALAEGTTTILNSATDPEIVDFAKFMTAMGARIKGAGGPVIEIEGVDSLRGADHIPIGDRLEAGTYLYGALATRGDVTVRGVEPEHLAVPLLKMEEMGAEVVTSPGSIRVAIKSRPRAVNITTAVFPGFPTDLQPCAMTALVTAEGTGFIRETIFENRFLQVMELLRLGAEITINGDRATVHGVHKLEGAEVMASDIRAGAALVLAALSASGTTEVLRVYHIDRGYENIERRLASLGAKIERADQYTWKRSP
ncbi:MAG TPA: UDP-N-acetylglucosamine 1-carboxyvinyltransferase [candidate division Zixibacteria bacterium]|nr:UDP-N-acetylglucosamine 1-carboxyvinyltransferase [candidate division Zixibacteria bacterium]